LAKQLLFRILLDGGQKLFVHVNLVGLPLLGDCVGLFLLLKDLALAVTDLLGLLAAEVFIINVVRNGDPRDINLGLGSNAVDLIDPSHGTPIDTERSGDKQKSRGQLLQENHTLALVDSGDHDEDGARSDGGAELVVVLTEGLLVVGKTLGAALGRQRPRGLGQLDDTLFAVLFASNFFGHGRCLLDNNFLLCLFVFDEGSLLVVHLGTGKPHDSSTDLCVSRSVSHYQYFS